MQRLSQHQHLNIPTEIVRTVIAVSETGSLTKAAGRLGLSQPAVSSQIKRIQDIVGGELFVKTANGSTPTELGKLFLDQARRMVEANDQMLRLGGVHGGRDTLRLGISSLYMMDFLNDSDAGRPDVFLIAESSVQIAKGVLDGFIDVGCFLSNPAMDSRLSGLIANERVEDFAWVRARHFVLSPGKPIPILSRMEDDPAVRTLANNNIAYRIVFTSSDFHVRLAAAEAGMGLAAIPRRMLTNSLVIANEYYLPKLPVTNFYLCIRPDLKTAQSGRLRDRLEQKFFAHV